MVEAQQCGQWIAGPVRRLFDRALAGESSAGSTAIGSAANQRVSSTSESSRPAWVLSYLAGVFRGAGLTSAGERLVLKSPVEWEFGRK
jgi:hypothetical protein